jgi:hypothetical protein
MNKSWTDEQGECIHEYVQLGAWNIKAFRSSSRADIQTFEFWKHSRGDTFTDINISHG